VDGSAWISEDYLMGNHKGNFRPSYGENPENTVNEDNGILTRMLYNALNGGFFYSTRRLSFLHACLLLRHKTDKSQFHRNAGRDQYISSHDNLTAQAVGCIMAENKTFFKDVLKLRSVFKPWPILNNVNPGKLHMEKHQPSGFHHPGCWFMYSLAGGEKPWIIDTIWFCGNLIINATHPHYFLISLMASSLSFIRS